MSTTTSGSGSSGDAGIEAHLDLGDRHRVAMGIDQLDAVREPGALLGRRFKTPVGEIDLIAIRKKRVAFIEVKRRQTTEDAEDAITLTMRRRVRRAADLWLARNPQYQAHDVGFDLVFVLPWRFPIIMRDAL